MFLFVACGDSSDTERTSGGDPPDHAADAGHAAGEHGDAGFDETAGAELGAACDPEHASSCGGDDNKCLTELAVLDTRVEFRGGYCSAGCDTSAECGADGACPVGETRAELAGTPMAALFDTLPSNCLRACESAAECRTEEGYDCKPMTAAMPEQLRAIVGTLLADKPITKRTLCVPIQPAK
ncbi:MAG: hypothetical protein QM778_38730 [Myxococcales bacterium]